MTSGLSAFVTGFSNFKCLRLTPMCVPSQARTLGLYPQKGSISFQKSILKADSHPKKHPINVFTAIKGCGLECVVL